MYNYRCTRSSCRKRRSIRHKEHYVKCECGGTMNHDPEVKRRHRRERCYCDGPEWAPHRIGYAPWCIHAARQPTEEEFLDRYGHHYATDGEQI